MKPSLTQFSRPLSISSMALALATCFTLPATADAPFSFRNTPGKLPKDVVPLHYSAHLIPDLQQHTFSGEETVRIAVQSPTKRIVLNVRDLNIDAASLSGPGIKAQKLTPHIDAEKQLLSFDLPRPLAKGKYQLALKFHGSINPNGVGLFFMNYKEGEQDKTMLATTMEPTDARRMLPLWDEPAFRASFQLSVDLPASFNAYSNTKVISQQSLPNGHQRTRFASTPKMASYLVALVAGETERISTRVDGIDVGVVTTKGKQHSASFALSASRDLISYYNQYFGVRYPLAKLDHIALPGGFNGAMENWGAIAYNESTLLFDPKFSPESTKQTAFSIHAHEVAHMWFGDLVTMAWWDDLWLNEGFASWMGAKATAKFHPEWHTLLGDTREREGTMNRDARSTTHPIQARIETEEQANDAFDSITYGKGQAFLQMLEAYLGEATFQRGIRQYIKRHQYSNTTAADLWAALEQASHKPVRQIASAWTAQAGLPLVQVSQRCEAGQRQITLRQQNFRIDGSEAPPLLWPIPLQIGEAGGKFEYVLLDSASKTLGRPGCQGTLVVDPDSVGYFRVQYDEPGFNALASQITTLPEPTRMKFLADTWALNQAGKLPLSSFLNLSKQLQNEPRSAIWGLNVARLSDLYKLLQGEPEQAQMKRYLRQAIQPKLDQLGWDEKPGETVENQELRAGVIDTLALLEDEEAISRSRQLFARYLQDPASVPPSKVNGMLDLVGIHADSATWEALLKLLKSANSTEEKDRFLFALCIAKDPALAARSLQLAIDPEMPPQLASKIVLMVGHDYHTDMAWAFALEHKDALLKIAEPLIANRMLPAVLSNSANPQHAAILEQFAAKNMSPEGQVVAKEVAAGIRLKAKRRQDVLPQIRAALQGQG